MSDKTLKPWMCETFKDEAEEKGMFKTTKRLEQFGESQNEYNKLVYETVQELKKRVTALETEQERFTSLLKRCASELVSVKNEVDKLKLSSKLNTNTIKRLVTKIETITKANNDKKTDDE